MSTPIRVLIVEDQAADAELMLHELHQAGFDTDWQRVETEADFLAGLETNPDLILVDWSLPQFSGMRVLQLLNECGQDFPFVIVSGIIGEEAAVDAMRQGAADYVMKDRLGRLGQAVRHALEAKQLRADHRRVEEQLRYQANLLASVSDAIIACDSQYRITAWNAAAETLYGWKAEEVLGRNGLEITCTEWPDVEAEAMRCTIAKAKRWRGEVTQVRRDGTRFPVEVSTIVLHDESGQFSGYVSANHDITERKRAEQALKDSEQRFRDISDNAQEFIWELDARGRLTYISPAIEKILGYTPEEFLQKNFYDTFYPEDREAVMATVFASIAAKQPFREFINRNMHKNGQIVWLSISAVPLLDDKGNLLGYRGANTDITERKRAEEALQASEEQLRLITENMLDMVEWTDFQGNILYASPSHKTVLGYEPASLLGMSIYHYMHPEDRDRVENAALAIIQAETPGKQEYRYRHADGHYLWLESIGKLIFDDNGSPIGAVFSSRDITERKRVELAIQESEQKYRLLVDNASEAILVAQDGYLKFVNRLTCDLTGYSEQELLSRPFSEFVHPDDRDMVREHYRSRMKGDVSIPRYTFRLVGRDGTSIWVELSAVLIEWEGKPASLNFLTVITKRKRAEDALRASEEQLRLITDNMLDMVVQTDLQGNILYASPSHKTVLGYEPASLLGMSTYNNIHPEDIDRVENTILANIQAGTPGKEEYRNRHADGHYLWLESIGKLIYDDKGSPTGAVFSSRNITERKRVELAIQESEAMYRTLVENLPQNIFMKDRELRYFSVNENFARDLGIRPADIVGKTDYEFFPKDIAEKYRAEDIRIMETAQQEEFDDEHLQAGRETWIHTIKVPVKDENGEIVAILGIFWDISEHKRVELAIQESEQKYRQLVDNANEAIVVVQDGYLKFVNPITCDLTGYSEQELLSQPFSEFIHPDDRGLVMEHYLSRMKGERITHAHTIRMLERDGKSKWVEIRHGLIEWEGKPATSNFLTDITERKQAEETLKISRERLLFATEGANLGIWNWNTITGELIWSNQCKALFGIGLDETMSYQRFSDALHPDDRERTDMAVKDALDNHKNYDIEYRSLWPDGSIHWLGARGRGYYDATGKAVRMEGIVLDTTERRRVELALQESEQKYRLLVDNASEAIIVIQEGMLKFVNRITCDISGYAEQELLSRPFSEFIHPDDRGLVMEHYRSRMKGDVIPRYTFRLMGRDGTSTWVEISAVLIEWEGKPASLNFLTDIAERRQAELVKEALYTISHAAVTGRPEDLYLTIHRALGKLMPVDNFYIALYDPDTDLLSFPYFVDQKDEASPTQKPGRGLTEYVLRTGRPLLADRQTFISLVQQGEVALVGSDSVDWLGVPLKAGEKIFGVIAVQSYTESVRFSHADMEMLEFVSAQVTNVIERKLIQQRIADALELNLTLINASSLGISVYDSSGQCILANEALAKILGATRAQVLGQNYNSSEFWKKSGLLETAREVVASGKETRRETHTTSDFGKEVWLECQFTPFVSNGKQHLLRIAKDIAITKQAEIDLQVYATALEQSNRDLQEFAYVASHDLQEPLRKVLAFSDLIVSEYGDALDETGRDYMKRMESASQRMMTLITDLLSFARVETRSRPYTEVDLKTVAQEVISDLENQIERTQGRIEIGNLPMIEADPTQMHQLLQNLIINALKFQREGSSPLIKISANIDGDDCQISVEDNGIGFDIKYLDRIFKPFERLHSREEYVGSGMGLAICRRIAERHRGKITATTTPGEGSTFIVTMPIHQSKRRQT